MSNFVALIVEDDPFQRECLADLLKSKGLEVVECANGEVAELVLAKTGPELRALVTDVELAGKVSGVELAQYAKRKFPGLAVAIGPTASGFRKFVWRPRSPGWRSALDHLPVGSVRRAALHAAAP